MLRSSPAGRHYIYVSHWQSKSGLRHRALFSSCCRAGPRLRTDEVCLVGSRASGQQQLLLLRVEQPQRSLQRLRGSAKTHRCACSLSSRPLVSTLPVSLPAMLAVDSSPWRQKSCRVDSRFWGARPCIHTRFVSISCAPANDIPADHWCYFRQGLAGWRVCSRTIPPCSVAAKVWFKTADEPFQMLLPTIRGMPPTRVASSPPSPHWPQISSVVTLRRRFFSSCGSRQVPCHHVGQSSKHRRAQASTAVAMHSSAQY